MPKQGYRTITIRKDVADRLLSDAREYKGIDKKIGLTEFVEILLDAKRNLRYMGVRFEVISYHKDHVLLRDLKNKEGIRVWLKKGSVECSAHGNDECVHAGFAYSLSKVQRIISVL